MHKPSRGASGPYRNREEPRNKHEQGSPRRNKNSSGRSAVFNIDFVKNSLSLHKPKNDQANPPRHDDSPNDDKIDSRPLKDDPVNRRSSNSQTDSARGDLNGGQSAHRDRRSLTYPDPRDQ